MFVMRSDVRHSLPTKKSLRLPIRFAGRRGDSAPAALGGADIAEVLETRIAAGLLSPSARDAILACEWGPREKMSVLDLACELLDRFQRREMRRIADEMLERAADSRRDARESLRGIAEQLEGLFAIGTGPAMMCSCALESMPLAPATIDTTVPHSNASRAWYGVGRRRGEPNDRPSGA